MCTPASYQQQRTRLGKAKYFDGPIYTFFFLAKQAKSLRQSGGEGVTDPRTHIGWRPSSRPGGRC